MAFANLAFWNGRKMCYQTKIDSIGSSNMYFRTLTVDSDHLVEATSVKKVYIDE